METPQKFTSSRESPDIFNAVDVSPYALDLSLSKLKYLQDKLLGHPGKSGKKTIINNW